MRHDHLNSARELLVSFGSRAEGIGTLKMALTNSITIPDDPKAKGFKSTVGDNGTLVLAALVRAGADFTWIGEAPDGKSVEDLRSRMSKVLYSFRKAGGDSYTFVRQLAGLTAWQFQRATFDALVDELDTGVVTQDEALERIEPYLQTA